MPNLLTYARALSAALLIAALALLLGACSATGDKSADAREWGVEKLYAEAKSALDDEQYELAIQRYEMLESRFPFGAYAEQALLDVAYAYMKFDEPDTAVAGADRFIKLHPRHDNVDYAYYLRGLARMGGKQDLSSRFLPIKAREASRRDPTSTREAYEYFNELAQKFPNSRYTPDALARMDKLRNTLAEHEIHVARYYLEHEAYVAAVNRAHYVIEQFPTTPASRTAVEILAQGYSALGMEDLAADARRVQELNAPAAEK